MITIPGHKVTLSRHAVSAVEKPSKLRTSVLYYIFKALILKYVSISGRAGRKEFWSFTFFVMCLELAVSLWSMWFLDKNPQYAENKSFFLGLYAVSFGLLPPKITIVIRRVHDLGKSAWWLFVPTLKILLFPFIKGDNEENKFGKPE